MSPHTLVTCFQNLTHRTSFSLVFLVSMSQTTIFPHHSLRFYKQVISLLTVFGRNHLRYSIRLEQNLIIYHSCRKWRHPQIAIPLSGNLNNQVLNWRNSWAFVFILLLFRQGIIERIYRTPPFSLIFPIDKALPKIFALMSLSWRWFH